MLGISLRAGGQRFPPATWRWVWLLSYFHRQQERRRNKRSSQLLNFLPGNWLHVHVQCLATFVLVMTNQNFLLSDQDGVWVGHNMSFQEKKIICNPETYQRLLAITNLYNSLKQNGVMNPLPWELVHCNSVPVCWSDFKKLHFVPVSEKYPMCPEHD